MASEAWTRVMATDVTAALSNVTITQWIIFVCVAAISIEWISSNLSSARTPRYPWINYPWMPRLFSPKHAHEYVEEGYKKFIKKDQPFKMIWWSRESIFLPPKYLRDLKRADEKSLSFFDNLSSAFSLHHSVGDLYNSSIMIDVLRKGVNSRLSTLIKPLNEELDFAIEAEIGDCSEWKKFKANELFARLLHRMTCRILINDELCRDNKFIDVTLTFMNSVVINALLSIMFPLGPFTGLFRSFLALFHRQNLNAAVKLLLPTIEKRLKERDLSDERPIYEDAIDWTIDLAGTDPVELSSRRIALNLLQNLWAGSAAPAAGVNQAIYQLLMMPEYWEPLRNEAIEATSTHGWTEDALNSLPLQDSFIKEINRMYPIGKVTAARTIMNKSFQFHDGLVLPAGTRIAFPIGAIQTDPDNFTNAGSFNGFRFVADSKDPSIGSTAQTISDTNLVFGFGKHACPGRFYAIRKMKLALCKLLIYFEIEWEGTPPKKRPSDFPVEGQFAPNLEQQIRLKMRKEL